VGSLSVREPTFLEELGLDLALLSDALDLLEGSGFLFAVCREGALRDRLMDQVREHLEADGRRLVVVPFSPRQPDLAGQLEARLPSDASSPPPVVFVRVVGLPGDDEARAARALRTLNLQRERLARLELPIVFWLEQSALGRLMEHAADLFAARSGIFTFEAPRREAAVPSSVQTKVAITLLDRFHRFLLPPDELRRRAALYERRLEREQAAEAPNWSRIALLCRDLIHIHRELDDHERVQVFLLQEIEAWREALAATRPEAAPLEHSRIQHNLGLAYHNLAQFRDREANLERAIAAYQEALRFRTPDIAPLEYARTHHRLGTAYRHLAQVREREANLRRAIQAYREALRFHTPDTAPLDYARTQYSLSIAYRNLAYVRDREANLKRAITACREALRFLTPEAAPLEYARARQNLGAAYAGLAQVRDQETNLEQAIFLYEEALRFRTPDIAPLEYARTRHHLGTVYWHLAQVREREANLGRAIEAFREALRFRTPDQAPLDYAMTQYNLGLAYADLAQVREREANLRRAIEAFREALRFWTPDQAPLDYAMTQYNLGLAYADLAEVRDQEANLRRAIQAFQEALRFWTPETAPQDYAEARRHLLRVKRARTALVRQQNEEECNPT